MGGVTMTDARNHRLARLAYGVLLAVPPAVFILISLAVWRG
jgi:hypothetical protein